MATLDLTVQYAVDFPDCPSEASIQRWAEAAMAFIAPARDAELTVRIVDAAESESLNTAYRHKNGPTNVLSFAVDRPISDLAVNLLGDIVICAPLVAREAITQGKQAEAHWAHLLIHGVLHLLGFDHQTDATATAMEDRETEILASIGYPDPYGDRGDASY